MNSPIYKVIFRADHQIVEIYAKQVYQGDMFGFLVIEELVFDERSKTLIDPGQDKLKKEFAEVKRSFLPLQNIIRIDEVERVGPAKLSASQTNAATNIIHTPFGS